MSELVRILEKTSQFGDFTGTELADLSAATRLCEYRDGEDLVAEGARADGLFFILDGQVAITRRAADGRRREIGGAGPGELLGLVGLVENSRRSASATAVGSVRAALLPRAAFTMLYESDAPVSLKFQRLIARQLANDARELNTALARLLAGEKLDPGHLGPDVGLPDTD